MTSSTTSVDSGAVGSATSSICTLCGPWKTAPFTRSALDLNFDVPRRVARSLESSCSVTEGEGRGQKRRRIEAAVRHEADRPRPQAGRPDDATHLQRLRLD